MSDESDDLDTTANEALKQSYRAESNAGTVRSIANVLLTIAVGVAIGLLVAASQANDEANAAYMFGALLTAIGGFITRSLLVAVSEIVRNGAHALRLQSLSFVIQVEDHEQHED